MQVRLRRSRRGTCALPTKVEPHKYVGVESGSKNHTVSAFWLGSSVVSVPVNVTKALGSQDDDFQTTKALGPKDDDFQTTNPLRTQDNARQTAKALGPQDNDCHTTSTLRTHHNDCQTIKALGPKMMTSRRQTFLGPRLVIYRRQRPLDPKMMTSRRQGHQDDQHPFPALIRFATVETLQFFFDAQTRRQRHYIPTVI